MDPVSIAKLGFAVQKIVALLEKDRTAEFEKERDEIFREWIADVARGLHDLEQRVGDLSAFVAEGLVDRELQLVWRNFMFEAAREAIGERRRMLAYAVVGTAAVAHILTVAQVARVERTMRELDPLDLRVLAEAADLGSPGQRYSFMMGKPPSGDLLHVAGCIRVYTPRTWNAVLSADLTELGRWVLAVARPWLLASGASA